jgi:hypothetical protein
VAFGCIRPSGTIIRKEKVILSLISKDYIRMEGLKILLEFLETCIRSGDTVLSDRDINTLEVLRVNRLVLNLGSGGNLLGLINRGRGSGTLA